MKRGLIAAAIVVAVLAGLILFIRSSPWAAQDSCLDAGGAWRDGACVGARPGG